MLKYRQRLLWLLLSIRELYKTKRSHISSNTCKKPILATLIELITKSIFISKHTRLHHYSCSLYFSFFSIRYLSPEQKASCTFNAISRAQSYYHPILFATQWSRCLSYCNSYLKGIILFFFLSFSMVGALWICWFAFNIDSLKNLVQYLGFYGRSFPISYMSFANSRFSAYPLDIRWEVAHEVH